MNKSIQISYPLSGGALVVAKQLRLVEADVAAQNAIDDAAQRHFVHVECQRQRRLPFIRSCLYCLVSFIDQQPRYLLTNKAFRIRLLGRERQQFATRRWRL